MLRSPLVTASPVLPSEHAIVVATERHVACEVGGEAVLLHLDQGVYYGLNAVGARVWQLIQQPTPLADLVSQVGAEFDVDHASCSRDLRELVARLAQAQLVSVTEAPVA